MFRLQHVIIGMLVASCAGCTRILPTEVVEEGALAVGARFPVGLRLQVIPEGTARIEVRVVGTGIPADSVLFATLEPSRTQALFTGVPAGPKQVMAKALDTDGLVLAAGGTEVTIVAGATVGARIRLGLLTDTGQLELVIE